MLSFEMWNTGFLLTVEGKRMLRHSTRGPCVWLRRPVRGKDGSAETGGTRTEWVPLRKFKIENRGPDRTVIRFEQRFVMDFSYRGRVLRMRFEYPGEGTQGLRMRFGASAPERVFGGGPRADAIDLKGSRRSAADGGFDIPSFMTSEGHWLQIFSSGTSSLRFEATTWLLETRGRPEALSLGFTRTIPEALECMTREPGPRTVPPAWLFAGAILDLSGHAPGTAGVAGAEEALGRAEASGLRISALLAGFGQELPGRYRVLRPVSPRLDPETPLYRALAADALLLKDAAGDPARFEDGHAGFFLADAVSPQARSRIARHLASLAQAQVSAGWALNDPLPAALRPAGAMARLPDAGAFNALWLDILDEATRMAEIRQPLLFGCSGLPFAFARGIVQPVTAAESAQAKARAFPASLVRRLHSLGMSGAGFAYLQTGRFPDTPEGLELWLRNLETAAFGPVFRVESPPAEGPMATPELWNRVAKASEHHSLLESYHRECARAWIAEGLTPFRHPMLHYPDESLASQEGIYLYGRDLLVAPAVRARTRARSLVLPRDAWVHLWSSRRYEGGPVTVDAPPGRPAVFYRRASPFAEQFEGLRRQAVRA